MNPSECYIPKSVTAEGNEPTNDDLGISVIDYNLKNLSPEKQRELLRSMKAAFAVYFNDPKG